MNRHVDIYMPAHVLGRGRSDTGEDTLVGRAFFSTAPKGISTTFRYDTSYLASRGSFALDPALDLFEGGHATADGLPYCFTDCAPDRWGRNLISKRLRAADLEAGRTPRTVTDVDYLLGVTDLTRQGALRFTEPDAGPDGPYLAVDPGVPKLLELPRLMRAAERVEDSGVDEGLDAVKELLDAGTGSLGGARPKASVRDGARLVIAKFSSPRDDWDVIAWEKTALDLAERAGLQVPNRSLARVEGKSVLLLDRFDRTENGSRIPYVSAMTLLTARDGASDQFDYTDLAETLAEHGSTTIDSDLVELWKRVLFSVVIHNTDDHLRNHGFIRGIGGWTLSPLFDVNPNPDIGAQRHVSIGTAHARDDELEGLRVAAPSFGLSRSDAERALSDMFDATQQWREVAASNGVTNKEMTLMADTFDGLRPPRRAV